MQRKNLICDQCQRGPFLSPQGLAGHYRLAHRLKMRRAKKDEILRRLIRLEALVEKLMERTA